MCDEGCICCRALLKNVSKALEGAMMCEKINKRILSGTSSFLESETMPLMRDDASATAEVGRNRICFQQPTSPHILPILTCNINWSHLQNVRLFTSEVKPLQSVYRCLQSATKKF